VPPSALGHLHMAPEHPEARLADDGLVGELPPQAIDGLLAPGESKHLRVGHRPGIAVSAGDGRAAPRERRARDAAARFFTHAAGLPTDAASAAAIEAQLALVAGALAPHSAVSLLP
jgi:hypothetical protein